MATSSIVWVKATIADGGSLSGAVRMNGRRLIAIAQPADCEGTAFGLKALHGGQNADTATYLPVYNVIQEATGAAPVTALWEVAKSATLAQLIYLGEPFRVAGPSFIKIQTENGSNAVQAQTGAVDIWLGFEELQAPGD